MVHINSLIIRTRLAVVGCRYLQLWQEDVLHSVQFKGIVSKDWHHCGRAQLLYRNKFAQGLCRVHCRSHWVLVHSISTVPITFVDRIKMIASKGLHLIRSFSTTAARNSHGYSGPGGNLPFDIFSKYKFTALLALYFSSGFGLPFLMVRFVKHRSL